MSEISALGVHTTVEISDFTGKWLWEHAFLRSFETLNADKERTETNG